MPTKDFDPHDPFDLVGKRVPVEEGHDNVEEMARCFIEEYLNMGWGEKVILAMFKKPMYQGPHAVYKARGDEYVQRIMDECKDRHSALMGRLFGESAKKEV